MEKILKDNTLLSIYKLLYIIIINNNYLLLLLLKKFATIIINLHELINFSIYLKLYTIYATINFSVFYEKNLLFDFSK